MDQESGNRRRLSRIVHDERGNARVEWEDLSADDPRASARVPLSIAGETKRTTMQLPAPVSKKNTDLRKLSEWIKLTREVNQRKDENS
jgi:hypothetical protein